MIEPHGGRLIDRVLSERRSKAIKSDINSLPVVNLNEGQLQDVLNIATGRLSPLKGFMTRNDLLKVASEMCLEDGTVWPLPVYLDVDSEKATNLTPDEKAVLRGPNGADVGVINVREVYKWNKSELATQVYQTSDKSHPGVGRLDDLDDFLVGGAIDVFETVRYNSKDLFPDETRVLFNEYGWETVVGFQTRNAPHRAHEYIQKAALELTDGLLIQPKLGEKKEGDYSDDAIVDGYETLLRQYFPEKTVAFSIFPSQMQYAGPREAIYDAIVRKNQGCTHFIIGRDHAGVGDYYDGFEAHQIFERIQDIGIEPLFFHYSFYCEGCDGMASSKICPHDDGERVYPSGSDIRQQIKSGSRPSEKVMRPEVTDRIMETDNTFVG